MVTSSDGLAPNGVTVNSINGNGIHGITNMNDLQLTGNGVVYLPPFSGQGKPNKFYPIDGNYPDAHAVPESGRKKLKIVVVGGGLAGAAAAGTLCRLPDVELKVYERADKVREAGALIGVMVSAMRSLSRMLSPAGWQRMQYLLYRGGGGCEGINHRFWRTGEIMTNAPSPHTPRYMEEGRISRQALHDVLMKEVPEGIMHFEKHILRVEKIEKLPENGEAVASGMRIFFEDGTTDDADLVVAADGLYSKIRRVYLPDSEARYRGRVSYRQNVPVELVKHVKGLPDDTSSWRRNGEVVFLSKLEPGVYSFVTMASEPEEYAKTLRWEHNMGKAGVDRLLEHFKDWDPLITQVIRALPSVDAYPLNAAPWMRDLVRDDAVAFIGDAAHPTAGAYGAGCSFAFGDVRALNLSLWRAHNPRATASETAGSTSAYDLPYALHLYNETRRHFLHRVERQIQMDKMDLAYVAGAGDNDAEWIRRYRERFTINWWILEHDVDAQWQEVEAMERHMYKNKSTAEEIAKVASTVVGD